MNQPHCQKCGAFIPRKPVPRPDPVSWTEYWDAAGCICDGHGRYMDANGDYQVCPRCHGKPAGRTIRNYSDGRSIVMAERRQPGGELDTAGPFPLPDAATDNRTTMHDGATGEQFWLDDPPPPPDPPPIRIIREGIGPIRHHTNPRPLQLAETARRCVQSGVIR